MKKGMYVEMQVIKRDGRLVEFNKERIVKAITLAMAQTSGGVDVELANKVANTVEKQLEDKNQATVYEIQDLIEKKLMTTPRKEVAQSYITYRYNRDVARKSKTKEIFFIDTDCPVPDPRLQKSLNIK